MKSSVLEYPCGTLKMIGELAVPEGDGPFPGVLVMPDARGIGDPVRRKARDLAAIGYVALATDPYGEGLFHSGERVLELQADADLLRARNDAALAALLAQPKVDANRVGAIGYCFGGQTALELARAGADIKCAISFHGVLTTKRPAQKGAVRGEILVMTGHHDPYAPPEDVAALQQEMAAAEARWQITVYGEGWHQFTDPEAETAMPHVPGLKYDPLLEKLSWDAALSLLDATIGKP